MARLLRKSQEVRPLGALCPTGALALAAIPIQHTITKLKTQFTRPTVLSLGPQPQKNTSKPMNQHCKSGPGGRVVAATMWMLGLMSIRSFILFSPEVAEQGPSSRLTALALPKDVLRHLVGSCRRWLRQVRHGDVGLAVIPIPQRSLG